MRSTSPCLRRRPSPARGRTSPPAAASLHLDETSWRQRGDMHWLWIAATDRKRAGEALAVLALAGATTRFEVWHRFKAGSLTRAALLSETAGYRAAFKRYCTRGSRQKRDRKWRSLGADLLRQWDCVFRFLETPGVEPTNKTAEQGPRSAVIGRRTTQGTRTDAEGPCRACSLGPGPSRGYRGAEPLRPSFPGALGQLVRGKRHLPAPRRSSLPAPRPASGAPTRASALRAASAARAPSG